MPRCGATFNEITVSPWTGQGGTQGGGGDRSHTNLPRTPSLCKEEERHFQGRDSEGVHP